MPEGPEVETIRRGLEAKITGQTIATVNVQWTKSFPAGSEAIQRLVMGQKISAVTRRAKVLMIELANGQVMMFHLKMTGQMVLVLADGERYAGGHPSESMGDPLPDKSTRVVFTFESGDQLFFNDQRKFGWIKLVEAAEVGRDALVARLGPEVLDAAFTGEYLAAQLARHAKAPVKSVILDQSSAAGIGNIYADESLHLAKIHPARAAGSLTAAEVKRLHSALRDIMTAGIAHGGTSFAHYVNSLGGKGDYL
ncbi:MAG TPA: bifunctional DNA-formamidopyrimidine glycosylase/DNA-(apurinic or apyrimidinic site) lyase, partial [Candidatus Saccharimonadia bacterium]|nr:bifunctional DNA-formamidopyrimidine glycosylase/DNA-(apurinic or apyrimidinic site) lyase [Candidatus Saccharimonadia bacterium]